MPLLSADAVRPLLRCPRCRGELAAAGAALTCASPACELSRAPFPVAGGQPALVDFASSVLAEHELRARAGQSAVARFSGSGVRAGLRRLATPRNLAAERHAGEVVTRLASAPPGAGRRLLVAGGGTVGNGAEALYAARDLEIVSFDLYASPLTQFIADAHRIPLADASVGAVWIQAVLEHVLEPARVVAEIERVLAPGGLVYSETPFLQHVHEGPWDFTRFTASGHRWLFRRFECIDSGVVAGPGTVWVWATEQLVRGLTRSFGLGRAARALLSWVSLLDRAVPPQHAVDGASCCFFFGRRSEGSLAPRDAVSAYAGAQRPGSSAGG